MINAEPPTKLSDPQGQGRGGMKQTSQGFDVVKDLQRGDVHAEKTKIEEEVVR